MATKKDISSPKKGMNRDVHESELGKTEYSFALNANFQDEHGNGAVMLQNETSNIYCSGFKVGYKVIGYKYDINTENTYFFLVNPTTGAGEIGYIANIQGTPSLEAVEQNCGCNIKVTLENKLEGTTQTATCTYYTIINDTCTIANPDTVGAFNFNIYHPILESNIQIKKERLGTTIYWTDGGYNPPRYIQLNTDGTAAQSHYLNNIDCHTGDSTPKCIDPDDFRIFKLFEKPCLEVETLTDGGNLRAGMYEVLIAYCNMTGDAVSQYYSMTNPIAIYDRNNNILDQTNLDYITNKGFRIKVGDLDINYEFYKIAVVYRSGLDAAVRYFNYNIYTTDTTSFTVNSLLNKTDLTLDQLLSAKPSIQTAKGLANSGGYLFQYGLKEQREVNLQPVVNLLGSLATWTTVQAKENLFEDGANVSKYRHYMRDEVEPFGIKFFFDGGFETSIFPLVPRPAFEGAINISVPGGDNIEADSETDLYVVDGVAENINAESVIKFNPECSTNERIYKWQFENTATVIGDSDCAIEGMATESQEREAEFSCFLDETLSTADPATISFVSELSLVEYINTYMDTFRDYSGSDLGILSIQTAIDEAESSATTCTPSFGELECGALVLSTDTSKTHAVAIGEPTITETETAADPSDYTRVKVPDTCVHTSIDVVTGLPTEDMSLKPMITSTGYLYKRASITNNTYTKAKELTKFAEPQSDNPQHLLNKAGSSLASLQTAISATADAPNDFTNKLHTNANWYKVTFADADEMIVELSTILCDYSDANSGTTLRVSVYDNNAGVITQNGSSIIITDLATYDEAKHFIEFTTTNGRDKTDFTGGVAYIAIDSPISATGMRRIRVDLNTATPGAAGTFTITYGGVAVDYAFTIDAAGKSKTRSNILNDHKANMLSWSKVFITEGATSEDFYIYAYTGTTVAITSALVFVGSDVYYYSAKPPCGCFNIVKRDVEKLKTISFSYLNFGKLLTYTSTCTYEVPILNNCDIVPHKKGLFSFWESTEDYPCNNELYNSKEVLVHPDDFEVEADRLLFEECYVEGGSSSPVVDVDGYYTLSDQADLTDKKIRHYKFPDNKVIPFMNTAINNAGDFKDSIIYPIGFNLSPGIISTFLDIAVRNGLISTEERSKINKYEIYRGDRRVNKSVIAKGILFDMFSEQGGGFNLYSNYPLNSLGDDRMNGNTQTQWYNSTSNINYAFHSPNTHFYKPTLPRELSIEGYVYGKSRSYFDTVDKHPEYTVLGSGSYILASTLGGAEAALELISKTGDWTVLGGTGGYSSFISIASAIAYAATFTAGAVINSGKYRLQWIQSLYDLGHPVNHAYYQVAVGHYNYFTPNSVANSTLRGLTISHYLKEGLWTVSDEYSSSNYKVNNRDREDSVFLSLNEASYEITYPSEYVAYDNTNINPNNSTRRGYSGKGKSAEIIGNAASPYVTLKQYSPAQYGTLNSIEWLSTGFCGIISNDTTDCSVIFGGDTFISRFALKRKFPFFSTTAFGLAPLTPFIYSHYWNINPGVDDSGRYYLNYKLSDTEGDGDVGIDGLFFPSQRSQYRLQYEQTSTRLYVNPEAKFYLYSYGFPHFLVESEFNCNYRYAGREMSENFYPNTGDIISYTQEKNVPIRELEKFNYNTVYSAVQSKTNWRVMPTNYSREVYDKLAYSDNGVIISKQDNSEISLTDPWLVYDALDSYDFPTDYGKLVDMDAIESGAVLTRFTNGTTMFETDEKVVQKLIGQSKSFNRTDLGYAGTQNKAKVSCEFGHFWADAKRGKVFNMQPGGSGLADITDGLSKWFKENLPFQILKDIPSLDIDNAYNAIGITMGWDDRLQRVFITKKDYKLKSAILDLKFDDVDGFYVDGDGERIILSLTDTVYFEDCSWTVAYSPLTKAWISYYSFKPNYYISYNGYFQTGINYSRVSSELGLWSHLPFLSSYQVYYGTLYPFTIEYAVPTKYSNSIIQSIEYMLDVRKYYDKYDYADIYGIGFNQAVVYNNHQNSGLLELHHQKENDARQLINYPKHNNSSVDILQSCIDNKWNFNYLYNLIRSDKSGLPIWRFDLPQVEKTIDHRLLDYRPTFKDRLRGSYFKVQLSNTLESRYKFIFMHAIDERNYYEQ